MLPWNESKNPELVDKLLINILDVIIIPALRFPVDILLKYPSSEVMLIAFAWLFKPIVVDIDDNPKDKVENEDMIMVLTVEKNPR